MPARRGPAGLVSEPALAARRCGEQAQCTVLCNSSSKLQQESAGTAGSTALQQASAGLGTAACKISTAASAAEATAAVAGFNCDSGTRAQRHLWHVQSLNCSGWRVSEQGVQDDNQLLQGVIISLRCKSCCKVFSYNEVASRCATMDLAASWQLARAALRPFPLEVTALSLCFFCYGGPFWGLERPAWMHGLRSAALVIGWECRCKRARSWRTGTWSRGWHGRRLSVLAWQLARMAVTLELGLGLCFELLHAAACIELQPRPTSCRMAILTLACFDGGLDTGWLWRYLCGASSNLGCDPRWRGCQASCASLRHRMHSMQPVRGLVMLVYCIAGIFAVLSSYAEPLCPLCLAPFLPVPGVPLVPLMPFAPSSLA